MWTANVQQCRWYARDRRLLNPRGKRPLINHVQLPFKQPSGTILHIVIPEKPEFHPIPSSILNSGKVRRWHPISHLQSGLCQRPLCQDATSPVCLCDSPAQQYHKVYWADNAITFKSPLQSELHFYFLLFQQDIWASLGWVLYCAESQSM